MVEMRHVLLLYDDHYDAPAGQHRLTPPKEKKRLIARSVLLLELDAPFHHRRP
jgi:hypothetical protein